MRHQAVNYSLIVGVFVLGALVGAFLDNFMHQYAIILIAFLIAWVIYHYSMTVHKYGLHTENL